MKKTRGRYDAQLDNLLSRREISLRFTCHFDHHHTLHHTSEPTHTPQPTHGIITKSPVRQVRVWIRLPQPLPQAQRRQSNPLFAASKFGRNSLPAPASPLSTCANSIDQ
jgi:hypothetical protein